MELIPEWAPNLHPMVVHFPIAILGIAIFFDFISFFLPRKKRWWTEEATAFLYGVGAVAAVAVYYTGTLAADSVMLPAEAQPVLTNHADWAWWTIWFYGIYAIVRIVATWWVREAHRLKYHIGFFLLSLLGIYFLFQTGDHGAQMVFKHGVGVQAAKVENPVEHDHSADHDDSQDREHHSETSGATASTSFRTDENGNWSWEVSENAVKALQQKFRWLSSSAEAANIEVIETPKGYALSFSGENLEVFFVGLQSYKTEQVDYRVDMSSFKGTVEFVSHVQDQHNYDFVSIDSDGRVTQGRMINSESTIFEEGSADVGSPLSVRVVGNGGHFRGYINGELVVHGHGDAPESGPVGLKFSGKGTFLLKKMKLVKLQ